MVHSCTGDPVSDSGATRQRRLVLGKGRWIELARLSCDATLLLDSGCLTVVAQLSAQRSHTMMVVYRGECFQSRSLPPIVGIWLVAASDTVAHRLDCAIEGAGRSSNWPSPLRVEVLLAHRAILHAMLVGNFSGEERLATALIEQTLILGKPAGFGFVFDAPMSRECLADYLALNPDTVSRTVTRLKDMGILAMPRRTKSLIKDFAALCALSPVAEVLTIMYPRV
jgi:CRP/FNR family transcriptional regulator, anaerobic regulatory protein